MLILFVFFIDLFHLIYNETFTYLGSSTTFQNCVSFYEICYVTSNVSKDVLTFTLNQDTTHNITSYNNDVRFTLTLTGDFTFAISSSINMIFNNLEV
jgi:hypothetical protein